MSRFGAGEGPSGDSGGACESLQACKQAELRAASDAFRHILGLGGGSKAAASASQVRLEIGGPEATVFAAANGRAVTFGDALMQRSTFVPLNLQQHFAAPLRAAAAAAQLPGAPPPKQGKLPCPHCHMFSLTSKGPLLKNIRKLAVPGGAAYVLPWKHTCDGCNREREAAGHCACNCGCGWCLHTRALKHTRSVLPAGQ